MPKVIVQDGAGYLQQQALALTTSDAGGAVILQSGDPVNQTGGMAVSTSGGNTAGKFTSGSPSNIPTVLVSQTGNSIGLDASSSGTGIRGTASVASYDGVEGYNSASSSTGGAGVYGHADQVGIYGMEAYHSAAGTGIYIHSGASGSNAVSILNAPTGQTGALTDWRVNNSSVAQLGPNGDSFATGDRNYVLNGQFNIVDRGSTFTIGSGSVSQYLMDMFLVDKDGTSVATVSQQAFTIGQTAVTREPDKYLDMNITTGGSGASKYNILHRVEGVRSLAGQQVTLSFWGKAEAARTVTTLFSQNFGTGGSPSSAVNSSSQNNSFTTTWTKFSHTVTLGSISGKTLGSNGNDYLELQWGLPLNVVTRISIADVQLELGPIATPLKRLDVTLERLLCGRYFQKSFPPATAPADNAGFGGPSVMLITSKAGAVQQYFGFVPFRVPMRASPTVTFYCPGATTGGQAENTIAIAAMTGSTAFRTGVNGFDFRATGPAGGAVGDPVELHYTADAGL